MKLVLFLLTILFLNDWADAQVVNRYPYLQRPSQTTATIAWRRANTSTGTLYLGSTAGVWFDSMSTSGTAKKHFFDLAGLQEDTRYFYQVRSVAPNDTFVSAIENFYTAPLPLEDNISFLAYGDCGYNNSMQHQVKALMETEEVDFAIVTGDIDQNIGDNYDNIFFGVYKDMLKRDCHFTCIGNHDTYADNAATYMDDFYLFSNNPANTERYYSYEWGDAKIICLDANLDYTTGSAQFNWMIDQFKCNDKKWLFIFFHQPPWTNAWSLDYYVPFSPYFLYEGDEDMRTDLVPEFEKYGVDFVVNGHSHCYQRGEMNGVQYLVTGGAGASTLDANTNSNAPNLSVEIYENHYVRFDISGDTAKYVMINNNGQRRDSVIVVKPYTHYNQLTLASDISCYDADDGSTRVIVNGPKPPYTYLWSNGSTGLNATGLSEGMYSITVTDSVGCARVDSIFISEPALEFSQITSATGALVICDSTPISLIATGDFQTYNWSTGDTSQSIVVDIPGFYNVTSYDSNGCAAAPYAVLVTQNQQPSGNLFSYTTNGLQAAFSANFDGTYQWNFGDNSTDSSQNPSHSYAAAGWYNVQLIIENACGTDTLTQLIQIGNTAINAIDYNNILNVEIQPNPFDAYCILTFDKAPGYSYDVQITDVDGKIIRNYLNVEEQQLKIDKENLISGVYFYTLTYRSIQYSGKLIVR